MWKIRYRKKQLMGSNPYRNRAMQDILKKDTKHILNRRTEVNELFKELKKYRDGGVTKREMRKVLAHFKYGANDSLTHKEVNTLAQELGIKVKHVNKQYIPEDDRTQQSSRLSHAKHEADFLRPGHTRTHSSALRNSGGDRSFGSPARTHQTSRAHESIARPPIHHAGIRANYMAAQYRHTR